MRSFRPAFGFLTLLLMASAHSASAQPLPDLVDRLVPLTEQSAAKSGGPVFSSPSVAEPFTGVIVRGTAGGDSLAGHIRFEVNGAWNAWQDLYLVRSVTDAGFLGAYRSPEVRSGQRFELRFSGDDAASIQAIEAGVFDGREDADAAPRGPVAFDTTPRVPLAVSETINPPTLHRRAEWNAAGFRGTPTPLARPDYRFITFHHAAGFGATTLGEGLAQVKSIQDFHQNGRGWSDIGYHFLLDNSGNIYQGRPFLDDQATLEDVPVFVQGAHVGGANMGNIGVCLLGCYHPPEGSNCRDEITPQALDSLATLFAFLSERYAVPPDAIRGHRDFSTTACPGNSNYALLPDIRARVRTLLETGNAPVARATLTAQVGDDGVVVLAWIFLEDNGMAAYRVERTYAAASGDEGDTTTVARGSEAVSSQFVDTEVSRSGPVAYRLYASDAAGREFLIATSELSVEPPQAFVLAQNFPNPATTSTTIRYYQAEEGVASLRVFDLTGQEVATLANGFQERDRWYHVHLNTSGLAAGVYLYRLQVEGFSDVVFDQTLTLVVLH